jgi:hypothetical protein
MGIDHARAFTARTDPVAPMIFVGKAPPGPAQIGDVGGAQSLHHIVTDTPCVWGSGFLAHPEPAIDATAQMFRKMAIDVPANLVVTQVGVDNNAIHDFKLPCKYMSNSKKGRG